MFPPKLIIFINKPLSKFKKQNETLYQNPIYPANRFREF